ncbi:hypothetical protein LSAT2_005794 [Lamellibrachia satsuma]|nr:hypothetical protein LSAT2_005794 [Lamellibrachia satsuma]
MGQIVSYLIRLLFGYVPADRQPIRGHHSVASQPVTRDYHRPTYENKSNPSMTRSWNTACQKDTDIQVDVRRDSCRTATVHWQQACIMDSQVDITITNVTDNNRRQLPDRRYRRPATERTFRVPTELTRGQQYEVTVRGVTSSAQGTTRFRADIKGQSDAQEATSRNQIQNAINKTACNHDGDMAPIEAAKVGEDLKTKAANTRGTPNQLISDSLLSTTVCGSITPRTHLPPLI